MKASDRHVVYVGQSGLGLPDRDDYFDDSSKAVRIREQYREHVAAMLKLLGPTDDSASQTVRAVMDIETELARASMTRVQLRDPEAQYNKMSLDELSSAAPNVPWVDYFQGLGIAQTGDIIVAQPLFLKAVSSLMAKTPIEDLRRYLEWCLIRSTAGFLSDGLAQKNFDFYGTVLNGQPEMKPREERVAMVIDDLLGEAIGQLYVERHFSPEAKRKINELVDHLFSAYRERIKGLDWMGPETKEKALVKLDRIARKLGYPDKWRDYGPLTVERDSYLANWRRGYEFEFNRMVAKLGKPVDRNEWLMTPPTVNAYYHPVMNEIAFPAGIMQPPFFDPDADDAVNYGGIGAVIGHELTHGFDDEGGKFDADGNLKEWWTEEDRKRFEARAKKLAEQYSGYIAVDDVKVNGELTLGENIADLGGVVLAYDAFREYQKGKPDDLIDGFTPDQRFFLGFAQTERMHARDDTARQLARTDPHSPSVYRVNGVVVNVDAFHDAFGTKPGDALYKEPEARIRIW
jgi:putative endopeptidase